jgi:type VI secretion system VasD/TssJ family lipoprotein
MKIERRSLDGLVTPCEHFKIVKSMITNCQILALAALVGGCGSSAQGSGPQVGPTCKDSPIEIFLEARERLNPNEKDQPMPVEVRVFLLKQRWGFDQLDFETVWRHGEKVLAKDLVNSVYITIYPGKLKIYPMRAPVSVGYVAIVGIFRRPSGQSWKHVVTLGDPSRRCGRDLHTMVHATLYDNSITGKQE